MTYGRFFQSMLRNLIKYKSRSISLNLWLSKIQYGLKNKVGLSIDALETQFAKTSQLSRGSNNFATIDATKTTTVFLTLILR